MCLEPKNYKNMYYVFLSKLVTCHMSHICMSRRCRLELSSRKNRTANAADIPDSTGPDPALCLDRKRHQISRHCILFLVFT